MTAKTRTNDFYLKGTKLSDVSAFDRSIKCAVICINHEENGVWMFKDPWSTWFPLSMDQSKFCSCPTDSFELAYDYKPFAEEINEYARLYPNQ